MALDGTKIKANAKRAMLNSATLKRRVNKLDQDVDEYLDKLKEMDLLEDADIDPDNKTEVLDKLTAAHQEIAQMQELIKRLKEEKRNFISVSDPDANLLRTTNGKMPAYNVQLIVDNEHKLIADTEVFTDTTDNQLMGPMLESYREELGELPKVIVADKGYMTPLHLKETEAKLQEQQQSVTILAANKKQPNSSEEGKEEITFTFDKKNNRYICSEGKPLPLLAKNIQKNKTLYDKYQGTECNQCPKKSQCTNSKRGRYHNRPHHQEWIDEYATRVQTPEAQALLKQRKAIVEHPNGTIKWMMAQAQFVLRGLEKVKIEINLLATCYNLKRMWKILTFAELGQRIRSYNWKMA